MCFIFFTFFVIFIIKNRREWIVIEEKFYKVWLSLINGLGAKKYINLINKFKTNKQIFNANKQELLSVKLIDEKLCNNILNTEIRKSVKMHLKYMYLNKIDIISILDDEYPSYLREIYSPPVYLYIKGNKKILNKFNIGVVGCRECSSYGRETAQKISYDLAQNGINIVSGLARGIDSYAHLGALYAKGITIAVLANGLDTVYPIENKYLMNNILKGNGTIISEYPLGTKPEKNNFPARNRIISGLSRGIVVVEAKKKSGTLITVDFALEQGRDVYVVPR